MSFRLESSNPTLNDEVFSQYRELDAETGVQARPETTTLQGVVNKTSIFVAIAIVGGIIGYVALAPLGWSIITISCLAAMGICIGGAIFITRNPRLAMTIGPVYALVEGFFLGALTSGLDKILVQSGIEVMGGLALQAFVITIGILLAMLGLYTARIIRPTRRFKAVVMTAAFGVFIVYGLSWVMWMFGATMPFLNLGSAFAGGTTAWIGLGINALILVVASLMLIIDFGEIEKMIEGGAPRHMEWYAGFALLVTLAWIYYEAVKLAFRLAIMFGGED